MISDLMPGYSTVVFFMIYPNFSFLALILKELRLLIGKLHQFSVTDRIPKSTATDLFLDHVEYRNTLSWLNLAIPSCLLQFNLVPKTITAVPAFFHHATQKSTLKFQFISALIERSQPCGRWSRKDFNFPISNNLSHKRP